LTGPAARRAARGLPFAKLVSMPYAGGLFGEDRAVQMRSAVGFCCNPNVGAAVIVGADGPKLEELARDIRARGREVVTICLDDCGHDGLVLSDRLFREAARLQQRISRQRRTPSPLSKLFVGVECGRSDPTSGIVSNPLIGRVADTILDAGGSVVFGETLEWLGAEELLSARAASKEVGQSLLRAVLRREHVAATHGVDLTGNNPNPTNVAAGLTTIEEKSIGSIAKSGSRPIDGVLGIGDRIDAPGLYAMDAPCFTPESLSGFVASGAQLLLFSTGPGNSYVSRLAPTIKLSANPVASRTLTEQLDFDACAVFEGVQTISRSAEALVELAIDVASGSLTWGEIVDEGDEVVSRVGEAL
jgi:altronate dehydratase large subunit